MPEDSDGPAHDDSLTDPSTPQLRAPKARTTSSFAAVATVGMFLLACVFALYLARAVFIPLTAAFLLGYVLRPLIRALRQLGIPNMVGTVLVFALFTGGAVTATYLLSGPAAQWIRTLPDDMQQAEAKLRNVLESLGEVREAVDDVAAASTPRSNEGTELVTVAPPQLSDRIIQSARSFAIGGAAATFILFFLLASGDTFLRRTVSLLPSMRQRKRVVLMSRGIERDVSRYLLTTSLVNVGLGAAVGMALFLLGMPNPLLWAAVVALLNFVPYLGGMVGVTLIGLVALVSFESTGRALLAPAIYVLLNVTEAYVITPHIHGRRFSLHPLIVFGAVGFFGWLWHIPGALMAVPILTSISIVCANIDQLRPIAVLMAASTEDPRRRSGRPETASTRSTHDSATKAGGRRLVPAPPG